MDFSITEYGYGARPDVPEIDPGIFSFLGEDGVRRLISDHYDLLVQSDIKHLFPRHDSSALETAKKHSADFFIQRLGGPDYYSQNRGNPMMVSRHRPFRINAHARLTWLDCYKQALLNSQMPDNLIQSYWNFIQVFSAWMVNTR
jgi:hemoglobin